MADDPTISRAGFNAMRWDCEKSGCFNVKRRPKIEVFTECFPRKINFGDVDGLVELNGFFCMLEWKGDGGAIRTGQRMTYERFTRTKGNIVFVVKGDAETMRVEGYSTFWKGSAQKYREATLGNVKAGVHRWALWTNDHRGDAP